MFRNKRGKCFIFTTLNNIVFKSIQNTRWNLEMKKKLFTINMYLTMKFAKFSEYFGIIFCKIP